MFVLEKEDHSLLKSTKKEFVWIVEFVDCKSVEVV